MWGRTGGGSHGAHGDPLLGAAQGLVRPSQGGLEEGPSQGGSPAGLAATERRGQGAGGLAAPERRQGAGSTGGRRGSRGGAGGLAAPERRLGAGRTGGRRGRGEW